MPSSAPQISSLEFKLLLGLPLRHSDYPNVQFWVREHWLSRDCGNSAGSQGDKPSFRGKIQGQQPPGVDVSLRYVEDERGIPVDDHRANEIRNYARAFWSRLADASKAAGYWEEVALEVSSQYRREMRHRFPEFSLCEFDWKSEQFATDNYPNWAVSHWRGRKGKHLDTFSIQARRHQKAKEDWSRGQG